MPLSSQCERVLTVHSNRGICTVTAAFTVTDRWRMWHLQEIRLAHLSDNSESVSDFKQQKNLFKSNGKGKTKPPTQIN